MADIKGYVPLSDNQKASMNVNKVMEEKILRHLDALQLDPTIEQRWLAIGRLHLEQAFMAINRSIAQPERVKLED